MLAEDVAVEGDGHARVGALTALEDAHFVVIVFV